MKKLSVLTLIFSIAVYCGAMLSQSDTEVMAKDPRKESNSQNVDEQALQRSRKTVSTLDNIFKQTIVLITDKYVHDEDDFAAGSAAVLLFKNISESGDNKIRLIDATGEPYDPENAPKDDFEKAGIKKLISGSEGYEEVITQEGKPYLRSMTPVPVVMEKCIMCHSHYKDVKQGEPIGAISYTLPIE